MTGYVPTPGGIAALDYVNGMFETKADAASVPSATVAVTTGVSGTAALNAASAGAFAVTMSGDTTFTFSGAAAGTECSFTLYLSQDGTGGHAVTWPSGGTTVKWQDAVPPSLSQGAGTTDILVFASINGGTVWYGSLAGVNLS